jgi:hypothetical protein
VTPPDATAPATPPQVVGRVHRVTIAATSNAVADALRETVAEWGGTWNGDAAGGALTLPVQAGLRHGVLDGRATIAAVTGGSELALEIVGERWVLDRGSLVILVTAALASVAGVLWPFFPALARFAPLGLVLGVSAWLVVVSRLSHRGPAELLVEVAAALVEEPAAIE